MKLSKIRYAAAILFGLIAIGWVLTVPWVTFDDRTELMRLGTNRLQHMHWFVINEVERARSNGRKPDVVEAVTELSRVPGADIFQMRTKMASSSTNYVWACLNPDSAAWALPVSHGTQVAAYWPLRWLSGAESQSILLAVTFSGTVVAISNPPTWVPLPLDTLRKVSQ